MLPTAASVLLVLLSLGSGQKWGWGWKEWLMKWKAIRIGMSGCRETPVSETLSGVELLSCGTTNNAYGHWHLFC